MKPYCRNNSNFTFREISCAPIKKDCNEEKHNCNCRHEHCDEWFPFPPCIDNCPPPPKPCKEDCSCKRRPIIIIFRK